MIDDRTLARALGIRPEQVSQLRRRGMPAATLARALAWFGVHGMRHRDGRPAPRR